MHFLLQCAVSEQLYAAERELSMAEINVQAILKAIVKIFILSGGGS